MPEDSPDLVRRGRPTRGRWREYPELTLVTKRRGRETEAARRELATSWPAECFGWTLARSFGVDLREMEEGKG